MKMRMLAGAAALTLLGFGLVGGCSLTSVVDIRVGECSGENAAGDLECQEALDPDNPECTRYKCVPFEDYFQCQQVGGKNGGEVCDGEDNDCDGLIDEPNAGEELFSLTQKEWVTDAPLTTDASVTAGTGYGNYVYFQQGDHQVAVFANESDSPTPAFVEIYAQSKAASNDAELASLSQGCYPITGNEPSDSCYFDDTVVAAASERAFFASINGQGCTAGEVRVGILEPGKEEQFVDRGLGSRDPSYRGVMTRGSSCTDNLSSACSAAKASASPDPTALRQACGASSPSIAAMSLPILDQTKYSLKDQALVTFLGRPLSDQSCDDEVNVLALGLQGMLGKAAGVEFAWSNPSGDGEAQILGTTRATTGAPVVSVEDLGYIVAIGTPDGQVELLWVPTPSYPVSGATDCPSAGCDSRDGVHTEPLQNMTSLAKLGNGAGPIDGVSLSLLPLQDGRLAVATSWVEGCQLTQGNEFPAKVQLLHLDISATEESGAVPSISATLPLVNLGTTRSRGVLIPTEQAFVVDGFKRGDYTASAAALGGFWVVTHPKGVQFTRLAAFDGQLVDSSETYSFGSASEVPLASSSADTLITYERNLRVVNRTSIACK